MSANSTHCICNLLPASTKYQTFSLSMMPEYPHHFSGRLPQLLQWPLSSSSVSCSLNILLSAEQLWLNTQKHIRSYRSFAKTAQQLSTTHRRRFNALHRVSKFVYDSKPFYLHESPMSMLSVTHPPKFLLWPSLDTEHGHAHYYLRTFFSSLSDSSPQIIMRLISSWFL